jgi:VCBS repeat-containing protein
VKGFLSWVLPMVAVLAIVLPAGAGAAGAPALTLDPAAWDYGTIAVGATASKTFALRNTGTAASAALTVSITGSGAAAFTKTADSCSATSLGPNKSCSITVVYSPSAAGATDTATLTASSKKPAATASARLTGKGTPLNRAPVAVNDLFVTTEDTPRNGNVLTNDSDPDNDPLIAILVTGPANGGLVLTPDGHFAYTPFPNFYGIDSFTYKASDGTLESTIATVVIQVTPVNDPPIANSDSVTGPEDTPVNGNVLGNDVDPDNAVLSAVLVSGPANGSMTLNADGSFTYTPGSNFNGGDSFTYKASDGALDSNTTTVSILITPVNDPPFAAPNFFPASEGTTATLLGNVLANDFDVDIDPLTVTDPCIDLFVNTSGVAGDLSAKLPGLAMQLIDASVLDGTPCLWRISTANGETFLNLRADGTLSYGPTSGSPFAGLETGDTLAFTSTYFVSDGMGAVNSAPFTVAITGES